MKRSEAVEAYLQQPEPRAKHIFEYDQKKYKLSTLRTFDEFMEGVHKNMYWNEVIFYSEPCKLYMDCELECEIQPNRDEYVTLVHQAVCRASNKPDLQPPLVIDGSRTGKFSLHLIWSSLWCKSPDPVARIASAVKKEMIMGVSVDMMVYPSDNKSPKTLRMPYCGKLVEPEAGIMLPTSSATNEFDTGVFCAHLITFHSGHSSKYPLPALPETLFDFDKTYETLMEEAGKRARLDEGAPEDVHILDWLETTDPLFTKENLKRNADGGWVCYGSLYCKTSERWHKHNSVYVNADRWGNVTQVCSDFECRQSIPLPHTEHEHVVFDTQVNIDWSTIRHLLNLNM